MSHRLRTTTFARRTKVSQSGNYSSMKQKRSGLGERTDLSHLGPRLVGVAGDTIQRQPICPDHLLLLLEPLIMLVSRRSLRSKRLLSSIARNPFKHMVFRLLRQLPSSSNHNSSHIMRHRRRLPNRHRRQCLLPRAQCVHLYKPLDSPSESENENESAYLFQDLRDLCLLSIMGICESSDSPSKPLNINQIPCLSGRRWRCSSERWIGKGIGRGQR